MKYSYSILLSLLLWLPLQSQIETIDCRNSCSYFGEEINETTYGFTSDREANTALDNIMKHTGLPKNFVLMAGNVPNAAAVIRCDDNTGDCNRYIIYNQDFMLRVKQKTNTDWGAISILAHEIGHHLSGHTLLQGGSRPNLELEADRFSGFILYNLGATLDEAQIAIKTFVGDVGSSTHPGRSARIAAITNGWVSASELKPTIEKKATEKTSNKIETNTPSRGVFWKHDGKENLYSLFVDGVGIANRCERSYSDDNYVVYDPQTSTTFFLENFKTLDDNQLRPGTVIGNGASVFWRHNGAKKVYAVYIKGETIASRCRASYSGDNYIVYDPQTRTTYFLDNFKNNQDNRLRKGRVLGSGQSIYWRHDGAANQFAVYINGESIANRCNSAYSNNNYIVYDPDTRTTYLLNNFKTRTDNQLRQGTVIGTGSSIFWRFNGEKNTFSLIVNGEVISGRTTQSYDGDDYVVYDPQTFTKYRLKNFKNSRDNQLRKGQIEQ